MAKFTDIIASEKPVVVDFYATWCGPCKMMGPILDDLKGKVGEKAKIVKVDVDKNPGTAAQFAVRGVPTIMIFKGGELKWRQAGVVSSDHLAQVIAQYQ